MKDDRDLLMKSSASDAPLRMAAAMGCGASILLGVLVDMALLALMLAGEMPWMGWLYLAAPAALWVILLGLPAFYKTRKGAMIILDAVVKTAEAWLARAGYVVDLNQDGRIGHTQARIQPPKVQEIRPILLNAPHNAAIMPHEVEAVGQGDDGQEPDDDLPERRIWHCPDGLRVEQETLEGFVDGVFSKGLTRGRWVPGVMERETYDGLMALLEQARLVEGRKPGHSGKLTVRTSRHARAVLGLPTAG